MTKIKLFQITDVFKLLIEVTKNIFQYILSLQVNFFKIHFWKKNANIIY